MSTPNLAASQELHTPAATNSGGSNGFTNGNYTTALVYASGVSGQQFEGGCCLQRASAQRRNESYGPGGSCHELVRVKIT